MNTIDRINKKILVTGAAGFVGSHLCDRLLQDGHDVVGLDNLYTGSLGNVRPLHNSLGFDFIERRTGCSRIRYTTWPVRPLRSTIRRSRSKR